MVLPNTIMREDVELECCVAISSASNARPSSGSLANTHRLRLEEMIAGVAANPSHQKVQRIAGAIASSLVALVSPLSRIVAVNRLVPVRRKETFLVF